MTLKEELFNKAAEVFDLRHRGMLTEIHKQIWEDVLNITERYKETLPICLFAHTRKCQVRFWTQNGASWSVSIRPQVKGFDAQILVGNSYEDAEFKARQFITKHSKFWGISDEQIMSKRAYI